MKLREKESVDSKALILEQEGKEELKHGRFLFRWRRKERNRKAKKKAEAIVLISEMPLEIRRILREKARQEARTRKEMLMKEREEARQSKLETKHKQLEEIKRQKAEVESVRLKKAEERRQAIFKSREEAQRQKEMARQETVVRKKSLLKKKEEARQQTVKIESQIKEKEELGKKETEKLKFSKEVILKKTSSKYLLLSITVLFLWLLAEAATAFLVSEGKRKRSPSSAVYTENLLPEPKPFSDYEATFGKRQLFKAYLGSEEMASLGHIGTRKMLESLTLVGIISTGGNYRALIRDAKAKATGIYQKGDEIGGFVIDEIKPDKVLLKCNEEIIELTRRTI